MIMTAKPAQIKEYVGLIKGHFLDGGGEGKGGGESANADGTVACYHALLKMECCLRGVLITDDSKLWTTIQNCLGKRLLTVDDVPKPLLAGMNVAAGRLAERCFADLAPSSSPSLLPGSTTAATTSRISNIEDFLPSSEIQGSIKRLQDINDERFTVLLLPQCQTTAGTTTTTISTFTPSEVPNVLLQTALGYFTAAATIQSDTPPMWKKVWDTWTTLATAIPSSSSTPLESKSFWGDHHRYQGEERYCNVPPFEAQIAIENLSRIADSKGNTSRMAQLQLKLVQSYLNAKRLNLRPSKFSVGGGTKNNTAKTTSKEPSLRTISECFGDDLTVSLSKVDTVMATDKAKEALEACRTFFDNEVNEAAVPTPSSDTGNGEQQEDISSNKFLFQILQLQIELISAEARVLSEAREMYQMIQNRSAVTSTSLDDCIKKCRKNYLKKQSMSIDIMAVRRPAEILRDTMITTGWPKHSTRVFLADELQNQADADADITSLCLVAQLWIERSISFLNLWTEINSAEICDGVSSSYDENWSWQLKYIQPLLTAYCEFLDCAVDTDRQLGQHPPFIRYGGVNADEAILLLSKILTSFPRFCWMTFGSVPELTDELNATFQTLSGLIEWKEGLLQEEKSKRECTGSEEAVGWTNHTQSDKTTLLHWRLGKIAALCFLCQDDTHTIHEVTQNALMLFPKLIDTTESPGYVAYLTLLVAWSGLFQQAFLFCANKIEIHQLLDFVDNAERPLTELDTVVVSLAKADALSDESIYLSVIEQVKQASSLPTETKILIECYCVNGLASINDRYSSADIEVVRSVTVNDMPQITIWHGASVFDRMKSHLINASRQLMADRLLSTQPSMAASILADAVMDSPSDPDVGLAYGACLLRLVLQENDESQQAKIQLIKTAKLIDSMPTPRQAEVFALLGIWFEFTDDVPRAIACFKKSLASDPTDPIAGRGILRTRHLLSIDVLNGFIDAAISQNSLMNGWAWHFVGTQEAQNGHDDRAAMALLKALRCRDVANPSMKQELFYKAPRRKSAPSERSAVLAEVGECYWNLSRFTSSIRAYHASIAGAGDMVPSKTLLSCAQIELELGLVEDAAERFAVVLSRGEPPLLPVASYWYSVALFHLAKRDLEEGKAMSALQRTKLAIESCEGPTIKFSCTWKLLGDMYSFGASVPPFLFLDHEIGKGSDSTDTMCLRNQLQFVKKGEQAFQSCLDSLDDLPIGREEDSVVLRSAILSDLACNILSQTDICAPLNEDTGAMFDRAAASFRNAIQLNPVDTYAWCGFGCAVVKMDPLLAQHAFCQSSFLDKTNPDPYSDLGFLYTSGGAFAASRKTMDVLTEIADTSMMWINRAFLLEEEAREDLFVKNECADRSVIEQRLSEAADAYRAALQVMVHPEAVMGLALTGRISHSSRQLSILDASNRRKESVSLIQQYSNAVFGDRKNAMTIVGVGMIEKGFEAKQMGVKWFEDAFDDGKRCLTATKSIAARGENDSHFNDFALARVVESSDAMRNETKQSDVSSESLNGCGIQRCILLDPLRADLWILLAKELIAQKNTSAAAEAASRATFVMNEQILSLRNSGELKHRIDSFLLSHAISLEYWLLGIDNQANAKEQKSKSESGVDETKLVVGNADASYVFQRALMMNPSNIVAREGMRIILNVA